MKTVEYFGYAVDVPNIATHLAADGDGTVYAFVGKPFILAEVWWPRNGYGAVETCYVTDCPKLDTQVVDWRDSLKEIKP